MKNKILQVLEYALESCDVLEEREKVQRKRKLGSLADATFKKWKRRMAHIGEVRRYAHSLDRDDESSGTP